MTEEKTDTEPRASAGTRGRRRETSRRIFARLVFWQTVASIAGIVIAVIALYAALTESSAIRRQTAASVWPYVQLGTHDYDTGDKSGFMITFTNAGVGPALMGQLRMSIDGHAVHDWREAVARAGGNAGEARISRNYLDNRVLRPGESVTLLSTTDPKLARSFQALVATKRVAIIYCYCSVFGDCWTLDSRRNMKRPVPVSKCPDFGGKAYRS